MVLLLSPCVVCRVVAVRMLLVFLVRGVQERGGDGDEGVHGRRVSLRASSCGCARRVLNT